MAYEGKKASTVSKGSGSVFEFMSLMIVNWWLIILLVVAFGASGFGIAKITYREQFTSSLVFAVMSKTADGSGTYISDGDAQSSATIATNLKTIIQDSDSLISAIQDDVRVRTGKEYSKERLRNMIKVEIVDDSTLINITVKSGDKDLAFEVATAIQGVYPEFVEDAFPVVNLSVADEATLPVLVSDSTTIIYTASGLVMGAVVAVAIIFLSQSKKGRKIP